MGGRFISIGAISAFLAVALGAFGAHGLKGRVPDRMIETFQTGAHYHLVHAVGLVLIGILALILPTAYRLSTAGWLNLAGQVIFGGSLYLLAVTGETWLGALAPIGGLCLMASWLVLALSLRGIDRTQVPTRGSP